MLWKIFQFDELESTNDTAVTYPVGSIVVAARQTKGRGRCGRVWQSPVGNLHVSFVLKAPRNNPFWLSFVAGVCAARALQGHSVRLKWPNDVLLNGKKVCGILLEKVEDKMIVGMGINLVHAPQTDSLYEAAHLGGSVSVDEMINNLKSAFDHFLPLFEKEGFGLIRAEWMKYAGGLGEKITVCLPNGKAHGVFENIDDTGALVLKTSSGEKMTITAGDIFLNRKEND